MVSTVINHKHESKLRSMRFHYHPISFPRAELEMGSRWIVSLPIPADPREPYMRVSACVCVCASYLHPLPMNRFLATSSKVSKSSCAAIKVFNMLPLRCGAAGASQTKQFLTTLFGMLKIAF